MKRLFYISVLSVLLLAACQNKEASKKQEMTETHDVTEDYIKVTREQFEANGMQLGKPQIKSFAQTVKATGMIDVPPANKQTLTSFYGGTVTKSALLVGDKVRKGQFLVSLSSPEFVNLQQEYLETKEKSDYLKNEYERQKTLFEEKITSKKKYLQAKSDYLKNLAMLNGLKQKLLMLNINPANISQGHLVSGINLYAKINGYITKQNASIGTYFEPNDMIMEIINPSHLHLELSVFEKDAVKIKKGQNIYFGTLNSDKPEFEAEVHLVSAAIDEKTRTIKVHGHLKDEKNDKFPVGMFVNAEIVTGEDQALALPEEAVTENELEKKVVLILQKKTDDAYYFKPVMVKTGRIYKGNIEIISGLPKDSEVLLKGAFNLVGVDTE